MSSTPTPGGHGPGSRHAAAVPRLPDHPAWQPDAVLATAILTALRLVEARLQLVRRGRASTGGAPAETEQAVLQTLCDAGPLTLPALAERLRRSVRAVGLAVTPLAARGLLEVGPTADGRRGGLVSVTRAGRWASDRSVDRETAAVEHAVAELSRADGQRLAELLTSLASRLAPHPDA